MKHKLELHVLSIEERRIRTEQAEKESVVAGAEGRAEPVKEEDVKRLVGVSFSLFFRVCTARLIMRWKMNEFSLSKADATRVLREAGGKLDDAIWQLIDG